VKFLKCTLMGSLGNGIDALLPLYRRVNIAGSQLLLRTLVRTHLTRVSGLSYHAVVRALRCDMRHIANSSLAACSTSPTLAKHTACSMFRNLRTTECVLVHGYLQNSRPLPRKNRRSLTVYTLCSAACCAAVYASCIVLPVCVLYCVGISC
jgi:hypothetical protein